MPESSNGTSKLLWMVIGAVVTGLIGIPVSYIVGILSPSATLGISVETPGDFLRLEAPSKVRIVVSNTTRFLTAKPTTVRVSIARYGKAAWYGDAQQNLRVVNDQIRSAFFNSKIMGDLACKETARQSDEYILPLSPRYLVTLVLECGIIDPGQKRYIVMQFGAISLFGPVLWPNEIEVEAWYEGYAITKRFMECEDSSANDQHPASVVVDPQPACYKDITDPSGIIQ